MSMTLEYNYAIIDTITGQCGGCLTQTYALNHPAYVAVPEATDDYVDKYYNINGDQMWYWDAEFSQLWEECPSHNV